MRVLIAGALNPYSNRKEKALCEAMEENYRSQGHMTDLFYLPWDPDFYSTHEQILAYRLLSTHVGCDVLITVGYPAFALQHPRKYAFLFDFFPAFHAQYGTDYGFKEHYYRVNQDRKMVVNLQQVEKISLKETVKVFVASAFLQENLQMLDCDAELFSFTPTIGRGDASELKAGSILVESDLEPLERMDLLLQAVALMEDKQQISVMVPAADSTYLKALYQRITRLHLQDRVQVYERAITLDDLQGCCGTVSIRRFSEFFPAYISHGLAMGVPCVVSKDGGALCNSMNHSENLIGADADARSIAESLQRLTIQTFKRKTPQEPMNADFPKLLERLVR